MGAYEDQGVLLCCGAMAKRNAPLMFADDYGMFS